MKNLKIIAALLLLGAGWFACRDKDPLPFVPDADITFVGNVVDEAGDPVSGAQVFAGSESATTDNNGVFRLPAVSLPEDDAIISVRKAGYFEFSRAYIVEDGATMEVTVRLLQKTQVGQINAASGGTVQVPGGPTLVFPAGAVDYNGSVSVSARYLDPNDPELSTFMPGDLRAIGVDGSRSTLATFGMLAVELNGAGGQVLNITDDSEVEIRMPIPANQLSAAPADIPLWYFDLDKARWIEEGTAQKSGAEYVGKVKHFSYWNCDIPLPLVKVSGKVYLENDQNPLSAHVVFSYSLYSGKCHGWTDMNGCFNGEIPRDVQLELRIYLDGCPDPVYTATVGPFADDVVLPPIIITGSQVPFVTIDGHLEDCNGQAVINGYVKVEIGSNRLLLYTDANGDFSRAVNNCGNNTSGTATGYDLSNLLESTPLPFSISGSSVSLGNIQACNALTEYIIYNLDGQSFTQLNVSGSVFNGSTFLSSSDSLVQQFIQFSFTNNNQTGSYPLDFIFVNGVEAGNQALGGVLTDVTEAGNVGEPIKGTFGGSFNAPNGNNHTISGSYRVIRDQ
ncbi:MAG: carboxypeptidase regulatory-like domain-containing protein [Saprospiraceae bacterium]|nr:carboxypeptidase regulatory-like domain-containing protein [Saprospiraceae bacterium]